ncbi:MAG: tRNA (N6-isopentenyl adenosine(37)-C2)-methylthiotransferase MiaB [Ignavibacteriales bacterium]|nr:tRNA (N6-isopentenyl adenosine(37)-C2)-methylthiotransferase MiaB [Ignavibacteriales bacterium]
MNVADTEVVQSVMSKNGFAMTSTMENADVILVNTCSVRDNAEQRIIARLGDFKHYKKQNPNVVIGVLGCMAERLRSKMMDENVQTINSVVDIVVGPDEYRKLPQLIDEAFDGEKGIAVRLSRVENYDDIIPFRADGISAWISVMRGCDKFCTFCVVPFTRGRERSRTVASVVNEVRELSSRGFKEVYLLGQNVNSFLDLETEKDFSDLLSEIANVDRTMRVRFTTSHPQDMSEKLIRTIAGNENICKFIHLPVQSGSDRILELMNRTYDSKHYRSLVDKIRKHIPNASLSTDIIVGFPTETEEDHQQTMAMMKEIGYDGAFMFHYSPRENTKAFNWDDDVSQEIKTRRLYEMNEMQREISFKLNQKLIGTIETILVESESKKSSEEFCGRTDTNKTVIFPKENLKVGDYVQVKIERVNSATLFGRVIGNYSFGH